MDTKDMSCKWSLLASLALILHPRELGLLLLLESLFDPLTEIFRKLSVASSANRLRVPRREFTFLQKLLASIAEKVLLMVRFVKELLTSCRDRLLAEGAIVTEELNIMGLTIRETVVLEVMGLDESLVTDVASKMVRMPDLTKGSN